MSPTKFSIVSLNFNIGLCGVLSIAPTNSCLINFMDQSLFGDCIRYLESVSDLYPCGIPANIRAAPIASDLANYQAKISKKYKVTFLFDGKVEAGSASIDLLEGIVTKGLKLPISQALLLGTLDTRNVVERGALLKEIATSEILVVMGEASKEFFDNLVERKLLSDRRGKAVFNGETIRYLNTCALRDVLGDSNKKKDFWLELKSFWSE